MEFKVKHLMVNLLQANTADGCVTTCLPTHPDGPKTYTAEQSLVALTLLKGQLKEQLEDAEKEEKALEAKLSPDQLERVNALSKRLEDALDEVEEVLEELSKGSPSAPEEKSAEPK
jgi:hypothetical protein